MTNKQALKSSGVFLTRVLTAFCLIILSVFVCRTVLGSIIHADEGMYLLLAIVGAVIGSILAISYWDQDKSTDQDNHDQSLDHT